MSNEEELRDKIWSDLYKRVRAVLARYGKEDAFGRGDFLLVDDNYGWRRQIVNIFTLKMLNAEIIAELRALLDKLPDWEIVYAVDVPGKEKEWPSMGVTIREREIIDGLQREYLPESYRTFSIPGSRPGTGYD
jgi:hypothetical protein